MTSFAQALFYIGLIAFGLAIVLVLKSLRDLSQNGPRIKAEIRDHYRSYALFAIARLGLWAFALMMFLGLGGVLIYKSLEIALNWQAPVWMVVVAGLGGILIGTALQFMRKLHTNPGLLIASLHYRASRLYPLMRWFSADRLHHAQIGFGLTMLALLTAATLRLLQQGRLAELLIFWLGVLVYIGIISWASWQPEARPARNRTAKDNDQPPNILMIGSDTLRADRLGALGYHRALTPHIDVLVAQGTLFANCYVPCARTAPSLVSMLTGTWPHTHGIRDNFVPDDQTRLKVAALPQLLKPLGYYSAAISDWCGADLGKYSFGFDYTDLPEDQWNLKYFIRQGPKDLRLFISLFTNNRLGRVLLPEIYYLGGVPLTTQMGRRARNLVSHLAQRSQPFFLNVFYSTTHPPFASEWPWYTRYSDPSYKGESKFAMAKLTDPFDIIRRQGAPREEFDLDQIVDLYDGCVAQFDDEVGKMLRHLDECGIADNTIVVVYSDHGMELFEHDTWGQGNSAVGEASPRIPLVIRDPQRQPAGIINKVVRSIDLAPTLLDLVGAPISAGMDGISLADCTGESACPELVAFNETGIWITDVPGLPESHLRYPNLFELIEVPNRKTGTLAIRPEYSDAILIAKDRMIRRGRWKLVCQPLQVGYRLMLFDVELDRECSRDIIGQHPAIAQSLWQALEQSIPQQERVSASDMTNS